MEMIIKTTLEAIDGALATVSSIVGDKLLQEDFKTVIVWHKDDKLRFIGNNGNIISLTDVEADVKVTDSQEPETFLQLKAKDINDVLATFRGLRRTKVSAIEFHIKEAEAVMYVIEVPLDADMQNATEFNQTSKFRISKPRLKDAIRSEIQKIDLSVDCTSVRSIDVLTYIGALLPTVAKETREGTNSIFFGADYIYSLQSAYTSVMPNILEPKDEKGDAVISGFKLTNTIVGFLKNFITAVDFFDFNKTVLGNSAVSLTVKKPGSIAVIKCPDMSKAHDITNFLKIPSNAVMLDKLYLMDVVKRVSLCAEAAFIEVIIAEDGTGTFKVASKSMTQSIPVTKTKGSGSFSFSIRAEILSSLIFSHVNYFDENIFIYLEAGEKNISIVCKDNLNAWHTKMSLTPAKGDFTWM